MPKSPLKVVIALTTLMVILASMSVVLTLGKKPQVPAEQQAFTTNSASISFSPATGSFNVSQPATVKVKLNTGSAGAKISAVSVLATYATEGSPEVVSVQNVSSLLTATGWSCPIVRSAKVESTMRIEFSCLYLVFGEEGFAVSGETDLFSFNLIASKVPTVNPINIRFSVSDSTVLNKEKNPTTGETVTQNILTAPSGVGAYTFSNLASLSYKVMFQGVNSQKSAKTVRVILKQGTVEKYRFDSVSMQADAQGKYSGSVRNIKQGTYDVFVKGVSHLQRKIPAVVLASGNNDKDWASSSYTMLAGDFNNDNVLNIVDIGEILKYYTSLSVPATGNLAVFDIDGDGLFRILDIALVLSNYTALQVAGQS